MTLLGKLLANRRAGESGLAWNDAALAGAETLHVSSPAFADGASIPPEHAGRRIGGKNVSPALNWNELPVDTAQLLLFIEDVDAPITRIRPRQVPGLVAQGSVLGRGRLVGTYQR